MRRNTFVTSMSCLIISLTVLAFTNSGYGDLYYYSDFASFDAVTQTTIWEDFASGPVHAVFPGYTSNGITYTGLQNWPADATVQVLHSDFNISDHYLSANGDEDIAIDFGNPDTVVGFDTYLNSYGPATIEIYGSADLLDTYTHSHDYTTVGFFGVVSDDPIYRIRWTTTLGRIDNTGFSNIRLPGSPSDLNVVPVPSAVILGGIGLAVASWRLKRMKH